MHLEGKNRDSNDISMFIDDDISLFRHVSLVASTEQKEGETPPPSYVLSSAFPNYISILGLTHRHFTTQLLREFATREKQANKQDNMFPETECGICYRTYNLSRRCPRQLCCKHTFCESCLVTLWRSVGSPEPQITCPLCRQATPLSEATIQENLPVDEDIFERLVSADSVEECADDEEDTEEPENAVIQPKEDVSSPPTSRKGHLMKCFSRLCKKFTGGPRRNLMTDEDLRDLAMMSCYTM